MSSKPPAQRIAASRAKVLALQDTPATSGREDAASARAWLSAPARGGSKTAASKVSSSAQRLAEKVALRDRERPQGGRARGFRQSRKRPLIKVKSADRCKLCQPERKYADTAKKIRDLPCSGHRRADSRREGF